MRLVGIVFVIAGLIFVVASLWLPVGFNQEAARMAGSAPYTGDDTLNIGLLQRQKMMFDGGLALAIAGLVLSTTGYLAALIRSVFPDDDA